MKNAAVLADTGIRGLSRVAGSGKVTPETIQDYTHLVYRNRLEVLYGYKDKNEENAVEKYLKVKENYKDIIQNANKFYDIVIVDLNKGIEDKISKEILNISDVIVYNIEQKLNMINEFKQLKQESDIMTKKNVVLNIGSLDIDSKYTIKNIARYLGIKKYITSIPYNTLFNEASSEEEVADLFLKIRKLSVTDRNAIFYKQVQQAVEVILYKLQDVQMKMS